MFTADTFRFLSDLAANNDRTWFGLNKNRYDAVVREPAFAFIEAVGHLLRERVSPHVRASRSSLFRIHRDTRFSKDKTPYKTQIGIFFPHGVAPGATRSVEPGARDDVHRPGFYLQIAPGDSFCGSGLWRPPSDVLQRVREAIVDEEKGWAGVKAAKLSIEGERLKRPPAGFAKSHPCVEDLMLKDFITSTPLTENEICEGRFVGRFVQECERNAPLVAFLSGALGLPW